VVAEQTKALKELRAENERLPMITAQSADAMTCLQAIYIDPDIKPEIRAAAAKAVCCRAGTRSATSPLRGPHSCFGRIARPKLGRCLACGGVPRDQPARHIVG
jgi:hypothetical protein